MKTIITIKRYFVTELNGVVYLFDGIQISNAYAKFVKSEVLDGNSLQEIGDLGRQAVTDLFALEGVAELTILPNMIAVGIDSRTSWSRLNQPLSETLNKLVGRPKNWRILPQRQLVTAFFQKGGLVSDKFSTISSDNLPTLSDTPALSSYKPSLMGNIMTGWVQSHQFCVSPTQDLLNRLRMPDVSADFQPPVVVDFPVSIHPSPIWPNHAKQEEPDTEITPENDSPGSEPYEDSR